MTDGQIKKALENIVVIIDTRENVNQHITKYFDNKGIKYLYQKLDFGDYSVVLNQTPEAGIDSPIEFFDKISLERKNSLKEISSNLSKERDRFIRELERSIGSRFIIMIEESMGYEKIINHQYDSDLNEKSFLGTLFAFSHRYGVDVNFIEKRYAGLFIYYQLHYFVREYLKGCDKQLELQL